MCLQVYETLADRKLHLLFELWDKDGDGYISFAELALGLRKFSPESELVTETAADAAEVGYVDCWTCAQKRGPASLALQMTQACLL